MKSTWIAIIAVVVVLGLWFMGTYNGLVGKQEAVNGAWAQVQNVYQRRADLVPNLVETVKGSANFEKSTLEAVVNARSRVGSFTVDRSILNDPAQLQKFDAAQGQLGSALSRLMVVMEKYPDLKANANFRDLQVQLEGTENRIKVSRNDFNASVQDYNQTVRSFPNNIFGGMFGFHAKAPFQSDPGAEKAPDVKF